MNYELLELLQAAHSLRCGRWDDGEAQARLSRAFRAVGINTYDDCDRVLREQLNDQRRGKP